ncbi:MAG: phosphoglucosamine mutase [Paludibacteraceae bacterium]|jgi:phosphoglucosamine mutase|nr:phosphoglucosamine mutase [Paludibacteraceae bacterium]
MLVKSISGIRGTIGGRVGEGLNPVDIVRFTAAYATQRRKAMPGNNTIIVGRDARISGQMVDMLVSATLSGMGCHVVNIGLATTPTTELAVIGEQAAGGIILTASHNPMQWNALKLLNERGEFLSDAEGKEVLAIAEKEDFLFAGIDGLGAIEHKDYLPYHVQNVMNLKLVDAEAIRKANFTVAIDCVNSVGGLAIPAMLEALGVKNIIRLNCTPDGHFAHNPEPIPQNLTQISDLMREGKADLGIVVDPDVDRLALICENGDMFGEEYTLVSVADYVLQHTPGNTVSNLSSSRALADVTKRYGGTYEASAVGEVNVTTLMRKNGAVIGGEGNGGVIYPASHYGRDALVGVALFLSHLAHSGMKVSQLRQTYPNYCISKNRIDLTPDIDVDALLERIKQKYANERITTIDGVKIDFADGWVHLRKSNTEPIIRIYSEAATVEQADALAQQIKDAIA